MVQDFFKSLNERLSAGTNKILEHAYLFRLRNSSLLIEDLRVFALQYYIYCSYFPRFLSAVAMNIPDDDTRICIIENLWNEHGDGDLRSSHRTLFIEFACGLDLDRHQLESATPIPSTKEYVNSMLDYCKNSHFLRGMGAIGPGTEYFTSEEYTIINMGLKRYTSLTDAHLRFFSVHIEGDDLHSSEVNSALKPWTNSEDNRRMILEGALYAINAELRFWDGLERLVSA